LPVTITAATLPVRMVADAHALEHRLQRLLGEGNVVEGVAGAVEADDEAVADQLVLPHAFDVGEVLDSRRRAHGQRGQRQRHQRRAGHLKNSCRSDAGHPLLPAEVLGRTRASLP
jgi:hypothetical protein